MIDLEPAPVPELSREWIDSRESALVDALAHGRRRPMRWAALTGAGVAATVSTLVLVGGSTPSAFAGWSATPSPATTGQLASATNDCQAALAQVPSNVSKGASPSSLVPELSDVRGPFTVTLYGDDARHELVCVASPSNASLRWVTPSNTPVSSGAIAVDRISYAAREGQAYTLVVGRTGPDVTGVILALVDGSEVTATSGNGFFVAWWPGSQGVSSASVAAATGTSTQRLNLAGPGSPSPLGTKPAPPPAGGRSSSGSSNNSTVCLIHSCGGTGG